MAIDILSLLNKQNNSTQEAITSHIPSSQKLTVEEFNRLVACIRENQERLTLHDKAFEEENMKILVDDILQNSDTIETADDFALLLGFKSDGSIIKLSPEILRGATTKYISREQYKSLKDAGVLEDNVEYNIFEDE